MTCIYDGSGDYHNIASAIVSAYPWSFSIWFKPASTQADAGGTLLAVEGATNSHYWWFVWNKTVSKISIVTKDSASAGTSAYSVNTLTQDAWNHATLVASSATDRKVILNGDVANSGTDVNSKSPTVTKTALGTLQNYAGLYEYKGNLAFGTFWNVALTDAEVASLAKGAYPLTVRPESIVGFFPLQIAANSPDLVATRVLTANGGVAATQDGPVVYFPKSIYVGMQETVTYSAPKRLLLMGVG